MTQGFKIGDIVQLKSGGPRMTVSEPPENYSPPRVHCAWFVELKPEHAHFHPDAIEMAPAADTPRKALAEQGQADTGWNPLNKKG